MTKLPIKLPRQRLLSLTEAAYLLGISTKTLRRWDLTGKILVIRTPGGQRRIPTQEIKRILGSLENEYPLKCCIYLRIQSNKDIRKGILEKQREMLIKTAKDFGYQITSVIIEKGSSLKKNRPQLKSLLKLVKDGEINVLLIAQKDSILPFGFDYLKELFILQGIEVVVLEDLEQQKSIAEISKDLLTYVMETSSLLNLDTQKLNTFRETIRKLLKILK